MAFQAVPDTAELSFFMKGLSGGEVAECEAEFSVYVRDEVTAWNATQLQRLADYGQDWFDNGKGAGVGLDTVIDDGWGGLIVTARVLSTSGGLVVQNITTLTGQRAGSVVPPSLAVLVRYQLDAGGSPSRGWLFVNAGTEPDLEGANWASALTTAVKACFDTFDASLSDAGDGGFATWAQVRVSRAAGTPTQLAAVKAAREQLRNAIKATKRGTATTNTLGAAVSVPRKIAAMRDRRPD